MRRFCAPFVGSWDLRLLESYLYGVVELYLCELMSGFGNETLGDIYTLGRASNHRMASACGISKNFDHQSEVRHTIKCGEFSTL